MTIFCYVYCVLDLTSSVHAFRSELAKYHSDTKEGSENAHATYLITGVSRKPPQQRPARNEDAMDVDEETRDGSGDGEMDDDGADSDEGEDIDETTVMLVGESGLESTLQSPRIMSVYQADPGWILFSLPQNPRNVSCVSFLLPCTACHPYHCMYVPESFIHYSWTHAQDVSLCFWITDAAPRLCTYTCPPTDRDEERC